MPTHQFFKIKGSGPIQTLQGLETLGEDRSVAAPSCGASLVSRFSFLPPISRPHRGIVRTVASMPSTLHVTKDQAYDTMGLHTMDRGQEDQEENPTSTRPTISPWLHPERSEQQRPVWQHVPTLGQSHSHANMQLSHSSSQDTQILHWTSFSEGTGDKLRASYVRSVIIPLPPSAQCTHGCCNAACRTQVEPK